jgi:PAS domain S-box-containing protein
MYSAYLLLLSLAIIINAFLIAILYHSSQKNSTIASLIILLIQVNVWFTPKLLTNALHIQGQLFEHLSRISALGYIFVPVTFLVFALSYAMYYKLLSNYSFWLLLMAPPIFFLYLSWTSDLVGVHDSTLAVPYPWGYETPAGNYWSYYMLWYDVAMLVGIGVLVNNYRRLVDQLRKRQALYIILAVIIPLVTATVTTGILPLFNIFVFPVGLILAMAMTIIGVTVIYRYGWFVVTPLNILSSINEIIITVDNKGNIIQMNPYSEKMLQIRNPQVIGEPLEKVLVMKDSNRKNINIFTRLLLPVMNKRKSIMLDAYAVLNKSNNLFATVGSITPIFSDKQGVIGATIFLRDASNEKEREKKKEDYFSMLSHELKTPLSSIKAYSQLLVKRMTKDNEKNMDIVRGISSNVDGLNRRINDFLELSRLTSGKFKLDREVIVLDEFVQGVIENMKVTYKDRKIFLQGLTHSMVFVDKTRIEQVITNFITNAVKFSDNNKHVIVELSSDEKSITVYVKDFGKGIHPKFQKKVFDRFFQIEDFPQEKTGLGMGLFIASTIIRAHNGKIWVESEMGKGSTFYFSLPINT